MIALLLGSYWVCYWSFGSPATCPWGTRWYCRGTYRFWGHRWCCKARRVPSSKTIQTSRTSSKSKGPPTSGNAKDWPSARSPARGRPHRSNYTSSSWSSRSAPWWIHQARGFSSANPSTSIQAYIASLVLFEGVNTSVKLILHIGQNLVDVEVGRFGLVLLVVDGVVADAAGTQRHEAVFWVLAEILSLQKLVMCSSGWYRQLVLRGYITYIL